MIHFLTGNKDKLNEARTILGEVEGLNIDLPEIQEINPQKVIEFKLIEAQKHKKEEFIVEDTSLYIDGMNGLPGPLIKWFLETVGNDGLVKLSDLFGKTSKAVTMIGYIDKSGKISYFEGAIEGEITSSRGENGFGWDSIFKPNGFDKTFAEMTYSEKNLISMRKTALEKLKKVLQEGKN